MKTIIKKYNILRKIFSTSPLHFLMACARDLSPYGGVGGGFFLFIVTSFPPLGGSWGACQNVICTGDSVVLTLTGYNGTIQWQQSPDLITWSSVSGVTVANDTFGFTATNTYYYRAAVTDGDCLPFYSDTTLVTTVNAAPASPTANAASSIAQGSFDANWTTTSDASAYHLDVAPDAGFTSFVSGYNDLNVGNVSTYSLTGLDCNTAYHYRVRTSNVCGASGNSGVVDVTTSATTPAAPTANAASGISQASFSANWTTSPDASTYYLDVATDNGFTSFVSGYDSLNVGNINAYSVTGLVCNTTYYYRVRANNSCGNSSNSGTVTVSVTCATTAYCGQNSTCSGNITDSRDGKTYATVQIVNQCWMAENLNVGTRIDGVNDQTSGSDNQNTSIQKYCYGNDPANCNIYGGLYQWDEMMAYETSINTNGPGPQGICPIGWHIPTDNEWRCLEMNLGMLQTEVDKTGWRGTDHGGKLKQTGTTRWTIPNEGATNSSGFTVLPGGSCGTGGTFFLVGTNGFLWSASEGSGTNAWFRDLYYNNAQVSRNYYNKKGGASVRCVKD